VTFAAAVALGADGPFEVPIRPIHCFFQKGSSWELLLVDG
jgi:hypothetical protein